MKLKLLLGAGAVAALAVSTFQVPAQAEPEPWLPSLTSSARLEGAAAVQGTLLGSDGTPMKPGTRVVLFAYPRTETMAALAEGASFEPTAVAKAVVGGGGDYVLRLERGIDLAKFTSDAGTIDFSVTAVRGRDIANSYFSTTPDAMMSPRGTGQQVDAEAIDAGPALDAVDPTNPESAAKTDVCGETYESNMGQKATIVGKSFTPTSGAWQKLVVGNGTSSSLGVGVSASGSYGSYSASGTLSKTSDITVDFGTRSGWYQYKGWFTYGKYSKWCYPVYDPSQKTIFQYVVRPVTGGTNGADLVSLGGAPTASYCAPIGAGVTMTKTSTQATTFSNGVEISGAIGIDLKATTGYTSSQSLASKNTSSASKQICGTEGYYGDAPGLVRIK